MSAPARFFSHQLEMPALTLHCIFVTYFLCFFFFFLSPVFFFFLMIRRPPRSTLDRSSAASDVYKRQGLAQSRYGVVVLSKAFFRKSWPQRELDGLTTKEMAVSYTHLRAHETVLDLVCRLLLEKKKITDKVVHLATADDTELDKTSQNHSCTS